MDVLNLMATLGLNSKEYDEGLDKSKDKAEDFGKKFTDLLKKLAVAAAFKKIADGIINITKSAVSAYSTFEQLEGGIETLFGNGGKTLEEFAEGASKSMYKLGQRGEDVKKMQQELIAAGYDVGATGADGIYGPKTQAAFDKYAKAGGQMVVDAYENSNAAAEKVIANADRAFETANLSANDYMQTAISFSSSLLQSLGGDTEKAAELTDRAIIDMADNANKMGTSMESIQNAYRGFSKQNFTMLDNLSLGYGGTKTEMQRLIKDANELRKAQGLNSDLTISSYADIIEAIHTVQENMGIAGTTAKESADTIEGSLKTTKAAWTNLLTSLGRGKDMKTAMKNLVKSAKNVVKNVMPVVRRVLSGLGDLVKEVAPVIINEIPNLIADLLPSFIGAVGSLVQSIIASIPSIFTGLWDAIKSFFYGSDTSGITGIFTGAFDDAVEKIKEIDWKKVADDIFITLMKGFEQAGGLIKTAFEGAAEAIKTIDWAGVGTTILGLIRGAFSGIFGAFYTDFSTGASAAKGVGWVDVGTAILGFILSAFDGLGTTFKSIFSGIPEVIKGVDWAGVGTAIFDAIKLAFSTIWGTFFSIFSKGAEGAESVGWTGVGNDILNSIVAAFEGISTLFSQFFKDAADAVGTIDWAQVGKDIWEFIKSAFVGLYDAFVDLFMPGKDGAENGVGWADIGTNIKNFVVTALKGIGTAIAELFKEAYNDIINVDWSQVLDTFFQFGESIVDMISKGIGDLLGIPDKIEEIKGAIKGIVAAFLTFKTVMLIANIPAIISGIIAAFKGVIAAINPVGTAIAAVVGLLVYFWNTSEGFRNVVTGIFEGISNAISGAINWISGAFEDVIEWVNNAITKVKEFFGLVADSENSEYVGEYGPVPGQDYVPGSSRTYGGERSGGGGSSAGALGGGRNRQAVEIPTEVSYAAPKDALSGMDDYLAALEGTVTPIEIPAEVDNQSYEQASKDWDAFLAGRSSSEVFDDLYNSTMQSMTDGSEDGGTAIQTAITTAGIEGTPGMVDAIKAGADTAAAYLGTELQEAVDGVQIPDFSGSRSGGGGSGGGGSGRNHATAMDSGEILKRVTPFGYDQRGNVHYAGDAGPEAVVGVNSLHQMIHKSVQSALSHLQPAQQPTRVQLVLDTGVLLGEVDVGLSERADWRGGGRA